MPSGFRAISVLSLALICLLSGCGTQSPLWSAGNRISGSVHGGQQPVAGATLQLYTVSATTAGASTPLLSATVTSGADGSFSISGLYSCNSATLVYITATGGNPGLAAPNPNLSMMAALGPCSSLTPSTPISINEVTTVAAVNALSPYMASATSVGSPNAASLAAAFTLASQLANVSSGSSPGTGLPSGYLAPSALVNTLADMAAACVNSVGGTAGDTSTCGQLFSLATPASGAPPTDVIGALLDIANNPTLNVSALFNLVPASPPFQPTVPGAPLSFATPLYQPTVTPVLTRLNPSGFVAGSGAATLFVFGTNLQTGSTILLNGVAFPTTFVASSVYGTNYVQTVVPATYFTQLGSDSVSTYTPSASPALSNSLSFSILPSPPAVLTGVSPSPIYTNSASTTLNVTFTLSAPLTNTEVVEWNGTPLVTSLQFNPYPTPTSLSAIVPASLLTSTGTATVTIYNPYATPTTSNALTVSVVDPPVPTLTNISPYPIGTATSSVITLAGTGFSSDSFASINGAALPTTFVSSTALTVNLPGTSIPIPGNYAITVTTPAPGGGVSNTYYLTVQTVIANNSMIYNPVNGLIYVSVPGSAGPPYGDSIVSVDPQTSILGTPIPVGSEPDKLALSSDGTILWVGLDGASAVRQVNLTTDTAGLQFGLGGNGGVYDSPLIPRALAALPGSPNSVVVSTTGYTQTPTVAIYDSGVLRASVTASTVPYALLVDGTKNEIYAGGYGYSTYTYTGSAISPKTSLVGVTVVGSNEDDMQIANNLLFADTGMEFNPETGATVASFISPVVNQATGSTLATGATLADPVLGKVYIAATEQGAVQNQIQIFNLATLSPGTSGSIPLSNYSCGCASRLTRWGTNGLAFRTSYSIISLRSNLVQDVSGVSADLGVSVSATGTSVAGANTVYTATVTNSGPANATSVSLSAYLPSSGSLVSYRSPAGSCSTVGGILNCNLGALANGASATVTITVLQTAPGTSTLTVQTSGTETDPVSSNNSASSTTTITGQIYNLVPSITSLSPNAILAGASATVVTIAGQNFVSGSSVSLGGQPLAASYINSNSIAVTVPATALASLGWEPLVVSNPSPGGGSSNAMPLSVFQVIAAGANDMVVDPYSRNIMASLQVSSPLFSGGALVAINPATATTGTPIATNGEPSFLALSGDGQTLYTGFQTLGTVGQFNMLSQTLNFTASLFPPQTTGSYYGARGVTVQTGTENTIVLDLGETKGPELVDFNPAAKSATVRGTSTYPITGSCFRFLDANDLFGFDIYSSGATFNHISVPAAGFSATDYSYAYESTLNHFGCFKLQNGLAFANAGGVANPLPNPAVQIGTYPALPNSVVTLSPFVLAEPDSSLGLSFFLEVTMNNTSSPDSVVAYNQSTFQPTGIVGLNPAAIEGNTTYSATEFLRWGQDGLAFLTSSGRIYLLRGGAVVPQLLQQNTVAVLTADATPLTHGAGNTLITLVGSNFIPGVAVLWNGSYRTTTIVDATHITVAIPASDLSAAATVTLTAVNPGAVASSPLSVTIQ